MLFRTWLRRTDILDLILEIPWRSGEGQENRKEELSTLQKLIDAEKSDLFDVLEYVSFAVKPITREVRVAESQSAIFALLDTKQKEFLDFVLSKYIESGVGELDQEKLPVLLQNKYQSLGDAIDILGDVPKISSLFIEFQKQLYQNRVAWVNKEGGTF